MTLQTPYVPEIKDCDGVAHVYAFGFKAAQPQHVRAGIQDPSTGAITAGVFGVDYTVALGAPLPAAGSLTWTTGGDTAGKKLVVWRASSPIEQLSSFDPAKSFSSGGPEAAFDLHTLQLQEQAARIDRCYRIPDGDALASTPAGPDKVARSNKYSAWNANGDQIAAPGTADLTPHSAYMLQVHAAADAAALRAVAEAAPRNAEYLCLAAHAELTHERAVVLRKGLAITDAGPGLTYIIDVDPAILRHYIAGLTLANNAGDATNDIDIAAGVAVDGGQNNFMKLASALTKRLDANWAVGNNQGGLDTGSIANDVYHVWLIQRSDTGVVDALFSASATAPTMPANYDRKRRIGAVIRAAGALVPFVQKGRWFFPKSAIKDLTSVASGNGAQALHNLSVPDGVSMLVKFVGWQATGNGGLINFYSPLLTNQNPATTDGPGPAGASINSGSVIGVGFSDMVITNTAGQIASSGAGATITSLWTQGWYDFLED